MANFESCFGLIKKEVSVDAFSDILHPCFCNRDCEF
jgi:hypothetical protein